MVETDPVILDGGVADDATAEAEVVEEPVAVSEVEVVEAEKPKSPPRIVSLDDLKKRASGANTPEARAKRALPFPLETLECDVLVAPLNSPGLYNKLFADNGGIGSSELGSNVDEALIREFILNCVVEPVLDDEAIDLILHVNVHEYNALGKFCLDVTMIKTTELLVERLGAMNTDAQELFFDGLRGRLSTLTPA